MKDNPAFGINEYFHLIAFEMISRIVLLVKHFMNRLN